MSPEEAKRSADEPAARDDSAESEGRADAPDQPSKPGTSAEPETKPGTDGAEAGAAEAGPTDETPPPAAGEDRAEESARPGPGPAPEPSPPAHPLKRKRLWLALSAFGLIVGGAATLASPFFAGEAMMGWIAGALAVGGAIVLLESFALPGWRGAFWRIVQGAALAFSGVALAFSPLVGGLPLEWTAAAALCAFGAAGVLCGLSAAGARGWFMPILGGVAAGGAGAAIVTLQPPPDPRLPVFLVGAALVVSGLTTFGLAGAARKA